MLQDENSSLSQERDDNHKDENEFMKVKDVIY